MYVELDKISGNARCWIYTLENVNRNLSEDINKFLTKLCENWMTHGQPVKASYKIYNGSYIILFAEKSISGCSIDDTNRSIREKLNDLSIGIMPNSKIGIFNDEKIVYYDRLSLINKLKEREILITDKMINTTVQTKDEYDKKWIVEINKSWLVNFIK